MVAVCAGAAGGERDAVCGLRGAISRSFSTTESNPRLSPCQVIYTVDFDAERNALTYTMANSAVDSFGVWRHSLTSGKSDQIVPVRDQCRGALRCALDSCGNRVFWTRNDRDNKLDGIWAMDLTESGTPKQIVQSPGTYPFEIECRRTWTGTSQLFWADITLGAIVKANADGSGKAIAKDVREWKHGSTEPPREGLAEIQHFAQPPPPN